MAWEMNETDARAWLRSGIEWIREGLTLTTTTVDDSVADMVLKALDNELIWGWLWSVLDGMLDGDVQPIGATPIPVAVQAETEAAAINPLLVLQIVKLIYDLWQTFRNK